MSKRLAWLAAPALLLVSSLASAGPTKSFSAATASLPADVEILGSSNLKSVRATQVFTKMFPELLKLEQDVPDAIDKVKKTCGIDLVTSVDDVTIGVDAKESGAFFLAVTGLTEQKTLDCFSKVAKSEGETVTSKKTGNITEVKGDKSNKSFFFSWQPGDVLVIAIKPEDKAMLERSLAGKGALGAKSKMAARIARANPDNALTAIWTKEATVERKTIKSGDLTLVVNGGNVDATSNLEMGSSSEADDIVKMAKLLSTLMPIPKDAPKELEKILKTLSVSSRGSEVKATISGSEKDIISILQQSMRAKPKKR